MKTPDEYLRADVQARQPMDPSLGLSEMLTWPAPYYPGSGTDVGPFNVFTRHGTVSTVVYCDGGVTEHDARTIVDKLDGWTLVRRQQFTPRRSRSAPGRTSGPRVSWQGTTATPTMATDY